MLEITGALTAARTLADLAKTALDARDAAKATAAVIELQSKLVDATSAALAMAEKAYALQASLSEAQREKAEIEAKVKDRGMYTLHELRPGAFAYTVKPGEDGTQPVHYLCQACYDKGVKAMLRFVPAQPGRDTHYTCPEGGIPHTITVPGTAIPWRTLR
jgi:hypothetical protein